MFIRLDHVGVVAHSWDEARAVLVDTLGFPLDAERTRLPEGNLYAPQNTRIYFVAVGIGETRIEVLIPQDTVSGIARYLARRGPGLHHLGYAVDDVAADAQALRAKGLQQIDLPGGNAAFFYPKDVMGILTELVPDRSRRRAAR
jgi:methylmalonyl-CoA/ethylmalonyl-CoA epimerase